VPSADALRSEAPPRVAAARLGGGVTRCGLGARRETTSALRLRHVQPCEEKGLVWPKGGWESSILVLPTGRGERETDRGLSRGARTASRAALARSRGPLGGTGCSSRGGAHRGATRACPGDAIFRSTITASALLGPSVLPAGSSGGVPATPASRLRLLPDRSCLGLGSDARHTAGEVSATGLAAPKSAINGCPIVKGKSPLPAVLSLAA